MIAYLGDLSRTEVIENPVDYTTVWFSWTIDEVLDTLQIVKKTFYVSCFGLDDGKMRTLEDVGVQSLPWTKPAQISQKPFVLCQILKL